MIAIPRTSKVRTSPLLLAWFSISVLSVACSQAPPKPTIQQMKAEASYGADLALCVDRASTVAESKSCRKLVDACWEQAKTLEDAEKCKDIIPAKDGGK